MRPCAVWFFGDISLLTVATAMIKLPDRSCVYFSFRVTVVTDGGVLEDSETKLEVLLYKSSRHLIENTVVGGVWARATGLVFRRYLPTNSSNNSELPGRSCVNCSSRTLETARR